MNAKGDIENLEMENDMLKCYDIANLTGRQGGWGRDRPRARVEPRRRREDLKENGNDEI